MAVSSRFAVGTHVVLAIGFLNRKTPEAWVTSDKLASSVNANPVVIRRVLGDLKKAGIVESQAGKLGGTRLARKADEIRLSDIWKATQTRGLFSENPNEAVSQCPISRSMHRILLPVFESAETSVQKTFHTVLVSELLERIR